MNDSQKKFTADVATVRQCGLCHRQHDGAGGLLAFRACVPELVACGRPDCAAVVARILADEQARRAARVARAEHRMARTSGGRPASGFRSSCRPEDARSPVKDSVDSTEPALAPGERQAQFVASGKADSANGRLLEFFEHALRSAQTDRWFARTALKEICGNDYVNNRVDDLRPQFAARGIKIVNGDVSPDGVAAASSHYCLRFMSDEEVAEFGRTQEPPTR